MVCQCVPWTPDLGSWLDDANQVLKANTGVLLCTDAVRLDDINQRLKAMEKH